MNIFNKILLSTFGRWFEILFLVLIQLISIPIIVTKWSSELLGVWVIFNTCLLFMNLPYLAQQDYIYNRNLKISLNSKKKIFVNTISALPFFLLTFITITLFVYYLNTTSISTDYLKIPTDLLKDWKILLYYFSILIFFTSAISGLFSNILNILGYYDLISWLRFLRTILNTSVPLILIFFNYSFVSVCKSLILAEIFYFIFFYITIFLILRKKNFFYFEINLKIGLKSFLNSYYIFFRFFLENVNYVYLRFIIISLFNLATLTIFYSIRIITGLLRQIIETLIEPLTIELIKSLKKNKNQISVFFELYYSFLLFLIFPSAVLLTFFVNDLFSFWTNSKIEFNSEIFKILLMGVLLMSASLPFKIIIRGNNLVKENLLISIVSTISLFITILILYKKYNIVGVCFGILISEIISLILNLSFANKYLKDSRINWPKKIFCLILILLTIIFIFLNSNSYIYNYFSNIIFIFFYIFFVIIIYKDISFNAKFLFIKYINKILYTIKNKLN